LWGSKGHKTQGGRVRRRTAAGQDGHELRLEDLVAVETEVPEEPAAGGGDQAAPVVGRQVGDVLGLLGTSAPVPHLRLLRRKGGRAK